MGFRVDGLCVAGPSSNGLAEAFGVYLGRFHSAVSTGTAQAVVQVGPTVDASGWGQATVRVTYVNGTTVRTRDIAVSLPPCDPSPWELSLADGAQLAWLIVGVWVAGAVVGWLRAAR